jgi:hypothetical protein
MVCRLLANRHRKSTASLLHRFRKNQLFKKNKRIRQNPNGRTPERPNGKRIITRNAFEIYEDQMDRLRKLSIEEKVNGKLGSMSAMVREAIDAYLQKKSAGK